MGIKQGVDLATVRLFYHRHRAASIIICIGMLIRAALFILRSNNDLVSQLDTGEAGNVARAIAAGRGFADPYFIGSGPTAHLMPTQPLLAGLVLKLFGIDSPISVLLLLFTALAEVAMAYFLLYLIGRRLGVSRLGRLMALLWLSLVPVFFTSEAGAFLFWEGGLALMLAMACLYHAMCLAEKDVLVLSNHIWVAFLAAVTFFVSPTLGLAAGVCYGWQYAACRRLREIVRVTLVAVPIFAVVFLPWVIRNYEQFGRIIPLRDNAGLELAIANHDAAVFGDRMDLTYWSRLHDIHPLQKGPGQKRVREIGEVVYFEELKKNTTAWITDHPVLFGELYLRHMKQMILPPAWNFGDFKPALRAGVISIANLIGVVTIIAVLARRRWNWMFPALFVLCVVLAYGPFQPVVRYYYPVYVMLMMCAAYWPGELIERLYARWVVRDMRPIRWKPRYGTTLDVP